MLSNSVGFNLTLAATRSLGRGPFVNFRKRDALIERLIRRLGIKTGSPSQAVSSLSGGNQQKVVVAKWLATEPKVLILDEPTRGVDVGAKREIYAIIDDLAKGGMGVILVSSELEEILNLCDAVCVVRERADREDSRAQRALSGNHHAIRGWGREHGGSES